VNDLAVRMERGRTPNFEPGRQGQRPRAVVVHTTQGTAAQAIGWFGLRRSATSAHYVVGLDGGVTCLVDERDTARHTGRVLRPTAPLVRGTEGNPNRYTIGIEFEDGGDPHAVARPAAQYAAGGRLLAGIAARWDIQLDRHHVLGHREIFAAKECPGNLDIDRLIAEALELRGLMAAGPPGDALACLLPVRNGAADLPGYLDSIAGFADFVIALDDGSTDGSAELLAESSTVRRTLRNPVRHTFAGWDDATNRQALLDAAADLQPGWVLFLDADERIDPEDGQALRKFLSADALPGCAYGLRLYRGWGPELVDPHFTRVYRVFAPAAGQVLPRQRLHFNPVPTDIPRRAWVRTTIRARHLDSEERLAARRSKYEAADPRGAFAAGSARLLEPPADQPHAWRPRPPAMPVLDLRRSETGIDGREEQGPSSLACLLPARNSAEDLPGYLESASRFADFVIALDDGSTDETPRILEASDLVKATFWNPRRVGYAGWDDAANRQALLNAATGLGADWAMFLDADERIDPGDAAALRAFVENEALPGEAYGFRVHRMIGDERHYDRADLWVYRLFACESGQRLPDRKLHFVPVPVSTPRARWLKTTVRIQHLASLTEERRVARLRKYEAADPDRRWQGDYLPLASAPGPLKEWRERPVELPVLADPLRQGPAAELDLEVLDLAAPVLSAVVISRDDEQTIERSVRSVVEQECAEAFEVIVVVSGTDRTSDVVRERFPQVMLVELDRPALPGEARNAGLAVARGDYVSFPGSHVELPPGSLAARIRAHELGYAMVTGSIRNGTRTRSGWASYFLDHSTALPGRPSGELGGAPAHCSYSREVLFELGGFPEELRAGEDTVVNQALWRRGHRAYRAAEIQLVHHSPCTGPLALVRHHYTRGRAMVRVFGRRGQDRARTFGFLAGYPRRRMSETRFRVARWQPDLQPEYVRSRPLAAVAVAAAWLGAVIEAIRQGAHPPAVEPAPPARAPAARAVSAAGSRS
jgi:glycosyltransferase involved in cell wall biosynthesis